MKGKWIAGEGKVVYNSEWATVSLVDVQLPDGSRVDHHVVSQPKSKGAVAVLTYVPDKGVLLMWRHRFIINEWTWEIPGGMVEVDSKETSEQAAAREMLEETGWRPGKLKKMFSYAPMSGLVDHHFTCYLATEATWQGPAEDQNEAADVVWVQTQDIPQLIEKGDVSDGLTLTALLWAMKFGPLKHH